MRIVTLVVVAMLAVLGDLGFTRKRLQMTAGPPASVTVAGAWNGVAPCLADTTADYVTARSGPREKASIAGFNLEGAALELAAFEALTAAAELKVVRGAERCRDVNCAARLLFGREHGPRMLRLALEYHYLPFGPDGRVTRHWSVEELDEVIAAFADLPPSLFPLSEDYRRIWHDHDRLHRLAAGLGAGVEVVARAGAGVEGIIIGGGWHSADAAERRASLVHEIAHEFTRARGRTFNWRDAWKDQMAADDARTGGASSANVSPYAAASVDEDFAESVSAYRYRAPLLKRIAPHRYEFLKVWVFDGLEYGSAAACAAPSLSHQVDEAARSALGNGLTLIRDEPALRQCAAKQGQDACRVQAGYAQAFRSHWRALGLQPEVAAESALSALLANRRFVADAAERLAEEDFHIPASGRRLTAR